MALGSSFAAGLAISEQQPGPCGRSSNNYAQLAAAELDLDIVDASCSGATIDNVVSEPQHDEPPQIAAVDATTRFVSITIGGNDVSYIGSAGSCGNPNRTSSCLGDSVDPAAIDQAFETLDEELNGLLAAVHEAAPDARIFLLTYPRLLPRPPTACPPDVPMVDVDVTFVASIGERLQAAFVDAADGATGVELIDVYAMSEGHDACAAPADRWVEGAVPVEGAPYHPNAAGMRAQADMLIELIRADTETAQSSSTASSGSLSRTGSAMMSMPMMRSSLNWSAASSPGVIPSADSNRSR